MGWHAIRALHSLVPCRVHRLPSEQTALSWENVGMQFNPNVTLAQWPYCGAVPSLHSWQGDCLPCGVGMAMSDGPPSVMPPPWRHRANRTQPLQAWAPADGALCSLNFLSPGRSGQIFPKPRCVHGLCDLLQARQSASHWQVLGCLRPLWWAEGQVAKERSPHLLTSWLPGGQHH